MGKLRAIKIDNVIYNDFPTCASLAELKNSQLGDILGFIRKIGVADLNDMSHFLRAKNLDVMRQLLGRIHFTENISTEIKAKNLEQMKREQKIALKHDETHQYVIRLNEIIERCKARPKGFKMETEVELQLKHQMRDYEKDAIELPEPEPIVVDDIIYDKFPTLEQMLTQPDEIKKSYFEFMNGLGVAAESRQSATYLHTDNLKVVREIFEAVKPDVVTTDHNPPRLRATQRLLLHSVKDLLPGKITILVVDILNKCKRQRLSNRHYCDFYKEVEIMIKNEVKALKNQARTATPTPSPAKEDVLKPIFDWKQASANPNYVRQVAATFPHASFGELRRCLWDNTTESAIRHYFGRWGIPHERASVKDDAYRQEHDAFVRWASEKLEAPSTKPAKPVETDKPTLPTTDIIAIPGTTKSSARPDRYATTTIYPLGDAGAILKELAPLGERKITIVSITVKGKTSDILRSLYKSEKGAELMRLHRVYISEDVPKDEDDEP